MTQLPPRQVSPPSTGRMMWKVCQTALPKRKVRGRRKMTSSSQPLRHSRTRVTSANSSRPWSSITLAASDDYAAFRGWIPNAMRGRLERLLGRCVVGLRAHGETRRRPCYTQSYLCGWLTMTFEGGDEAAMMLDENFDEYKNTATTWDKVWRGGTSFSLSGWERRITWTHQQQAWAPRRQ